MARPTFSSPIYPDKKSPSSAHPSDSCGRRYDIEFEVRAPYKGVDKFSNILPIAFDDIRIGASDTSECLPVSMSSKFHTALRAAIKGAKEILDNYDDDGYIDSANKAAIKAMIKRAEDYEDNAKQLREWWEDHFRTNSLTLVYGWPLEDEWMEGCPSVAPATGFGPSISSGDLIEFTCPSQDQKDQHDSDRKLYCDFLHAALVNARCAQEAAAAVGTLNRNREFLGELSGGMSIQKARAPKIPGKTITIGETSTGDTPEEEPLDNDPEQTTTTKKKKKGNGLLLAGGAALGLLLLGKKR